MPVLFQSLFFQRFRIILIPFVCPVPVLKSVTVSTGTVQQAGGCDQEKDTAEHWNSLVPVWGLLLMTAGHIQPFSVPACCDRVGISPVVMPG